MHANIYNDIKCTIQNNSHPYIYQMYDTKYETKERNKDKIN